MPTRSPRRTARPACPWYDWQGDLYNNHKPAFETVLSSSGGINNTRFFASLNDRQNPGTQQNSGARLTSGRLNLDQTIGDKFTVSGSVNFSHNLTQDGIGNNDNAGISPIYTFGYAPAIYDLQKIDPLTGRPVFMWMNGGGTGTVNLFDLVHSITNAEDTWRQIGTCASATRRSRRFTTPFSSPTSVASTASSSRATSTRRTSCSTSGGRIPRYVAGEHDRSRNINQSINAVWTFNPA
jgi:hypothetical protein